MRTPRTGRAPKKDPRDRRIAVRLSERCYQKLVRQSERERRNISTVAAAFIEAGLDRGVESGAA